MRSCGQSLTEGTGALGQEARELPCPPIRSGQRKKAKVAEPGRGVSPDAKADLGIPASGAVSSKALLLQSHPGSGIFAKATEQTKQGSLGVLPASSRISISIAVTVSRLTAGHHLLCQGWALLAVRKRWPTDISTGPLHKRGMGPACTLTPLLENTRFWACSDNTHAWTASVSSSIREGLRPRMEIVNWCPLTSCVTMQWADRTSVWTHCD